MRADAAHSPPADRVPAVRAQRQPGGQEEPVTDYKETAQYSYEAYRDVKGGRDGEYLMWHWSELSPLEQDAWREAAHAAIRHGWDEAAKAPAGRHAR
jgi:hypothetical protein